ncbi:uncharacterized protein LOC118460705 [Anopheles albimanus]|uniref:uncharacterized protein LOC118460705 n=1 Tax=Anopheles albimanus TaxID=7167 RepID=UPI0016418231|nr:uncharacterized protein LOC118460705 [Anopheles albimanus]
MEFESFSRLWKLRIINVVLIVQNESRKYCAYTYDPYNDSNHCGEVRVKLLNCYIDGRWSNVRSWFGITLKNFNGCPLKAGTHHVEPFVMARNENNLNAFDGLEIELMEALAQRLNFSIKYLIPPGTQRCVISATDSTGLMRMIQSGEVDMGFGATGLSLNRSTYLRSSIPSITSKLSIAIPPRNPYTSLEKLFLPFSLESWILIVASFW